MKDEATPAKARPNDGLGVLGRTATMAELLQPSDGSMVEFWCHRMSQQGNAGTGIRGWFRAGLFWSNDGADHYAPSEVTHWIKGDTKGAEDAHWALKCLEAAGK